MFTELCRIGRDVAVRQTQGGEPVADLALAYNYGKKDSGGNRPSQWIKGALWGKRAEALAPYLLKGSQVMVTLDDVHVQSREHEGKTYNDLVGRVVDIKLISSGQKAAAPAQPKPAPKPAARPAPADDAGFEDDDIPF